MTVARDRLTVELTRTRRDGIVLVDPERLSEIAAAQER
jgi:hypothetical protein